MLRVYCEYGRTECVVGWRWAVLMGAEVVDFGGWAYSESEGRR